MDSLTSISIKTLNDDDNSLHPMFNVAAAATDPEDKSWMENNANFAEDGEISIFDAEKYFSEENIKESKEQGENLQKSPSLSSSADGYGRSFMAKSTPSASSEASCNSQRALFSKNFASSKRWSAAKNWFFRRNCCCINGKSVGVKEVASNSDQRAPIVLIDTEKSKRLEQINPRVANDVVQARQIRAMEFPRQQRISATGRPFINGAAAFTFPISDRAREDDAGSDASSDLFEIESFSTQAMASAADEDSNSDRKFGAANFHRSRLSVAAAEPSSGVSVAAALTPQGEVAGGCAAEGKCKSNGMILVSILPEKAEAPPVAALLVGGRPSPADNPRRGTSQPSPLVAAAN